MMKKTLQQLRTYWNIQEIIASESITSLYQPIVSLHNGEIVGYEALSRGPKDSNYYAPTALIEAAEEHNCLWDLEMLFRKKAIEKAITLPNNKLLFINVDPNIIKDVNYKEGFTRNHLSQFNIDPRNIIFEITERNAIDDFPTFKSITDHYTSQDYKIAIDDVGSGYSGLKTINELQPDYVKIDMDLIRNIDTNTFKQAIIRALVTMAKETRITLIAEGIETFGELKTAIQLGVHNAQGYLLQKPSETIATTLPDVRDMILSMNREILGGFSFDYAYDCVGKIAKEIKAYAPTITCKNVKKLFDDSDIDSICIIDKHDIPQGMVMKSYLDSKLADRYGYDLYSGRNISLLMDVRPLIIDYYTPVTHVLSLAMQRNKNCLYDDVIITKGSKYYGMTTIYDIITHSTEYEKRYAKQLNPLTSLPGNIIIRQVLEQHISSGEIIGLLYIDLDHFKAYNDVYGFENGDGILKKTANLIEEQASLLDNNQFIGHIGGDDFVAILNSNYDQIRLFSEALLKAFDESVKEFFSEEDISNGYYTSVDRFDNVKQYPLTSISIAGFYGSISEFETPEEVGNYMGKIKKQAKSIPGSSLQLIDYQN